MRIKYSSSTTRRRGDAEELLMADLPALQLIGSRWVPSALQREHQA
jgi:hypothetical protein